MVSRRFDFRVRPTKIYKLHDCNEVTNWNGNYSKSRLLPEKNARTCLKSEHRSSPRYYLTLTKACSEAYLKNQFGGTKDIGNRIKEEKNEKYFVKPAYCCVILSMNALISHNIFEK